MTENTEDKNIIEAIELADGGRITRADDGTFFLGGLKNTETLKSALKMYFDKTLRKDGVFVMFKNIQKEYGDVGLNMAVSAYVAERYLTEEFIQRMQMGIVGDIIAMMAENPDDEPDDATTTTANESPEDGADDETEEMMKTKQVWG